MGLFLLRLLLGRQFHNEKKHISPHNQYASPPKKLSICEIEIIELISNLLMKKFGVPNNCFYLCTAKTVE